jgi:hypothetical protein
MQGEAGSRALEKHDVVKRLRKLLKDGTREEVMEYLKSLSPSGVELEILSLTQFDLAVQNENANLYVSFM